jgi:hypothetical protein
MTMAVGFVCSDGIVIGADRQITGENFTFPECKVDGWHWRNGAGILAYSGERDVHREFVAAMYREFAHDVVVGHEGVPSLIKKCLESLKLQESEAFLTLFGYALDGGRPRLLLSNSRQRIVRVERCEVIGYADSPLARSLLGRLSSVPKLLSVKQARLYAVDFISQAKKYDGQFVGDSIDVYSVGRDGDQGELAVHVLDAGKTGEWEEKIRLAHYWVDIFFSEVTDADSPMLNLELFMQRIDEFREWLGGTKLPWVKQSASPTVTSASVT